MKDFFILDSSQKRNAFLRAEEILSLNASSIEKDFWVCLVLKALFSIPDCKGHLTFKGGTSLSKVHKLIQRFSEDIDVVLSKELLGYDVPQVDLSNAGNKERKRQIKALQDSSSTYIKTTLLPELRSMLNMLTTSDTCICRIEEQSPHDVGIIVEYPSVFENAAMGYITPIVRIDIGSRSETWPGSIGNVIPYVCEAIPSLTANSTFEVFALHPERTLWEKVCLLHEETYRKPDLLPKKGLSRHYYDVACLLNAGIGRSALANNELFNSVVAHREVYYQRSWVDYDAMKNRRFRIIPAPESYAAWKRDYNEMREVMFFGSAPEFDEVLRDDAVFQEQCALGA